MPPAFCWYRALGWRHRHSDVTQRGREGKSEVDAPAQKAWATAHSSMSSWWCASRVGSPLRVPLEWLGCVTAAGIQGQPHEAA
jgi:hypothetical protein